ncbi:helix-turn-helix transcriptional regulator [Rhizobium rhizogenes]
MAGGGNLLRLIQLFLAKACCSCCATSTAASSTKYGTLRSVGPIWRLCAENGISPGGLILRTRLQGATDSFALDINKRRSVTEIALSWGFNDISYFNRAFRTTYGMTPRQMRHSHQ